MSGGLLPHEGLLEVVNKDDEGQHFGKKDQRKIKKATP